MLAALVACAPHPSAGGTDPPRTASEPRPAPEPAHESPALPPAPRLPAPAPPDPPVPDPAPVKASCIDDGTPYDPAALRDRVAHLASAELDGRASGSPGDAAARAYIAERFRCLGLVPAGAGDSYEQPFVANGHDTANVIGYVPGSDEAAARDIIVIGAHHDHLGNGHLGANDNASGVVALLAIAQAIRQHPGPRRTIAFVAFGGEELGLFGSQHFAAHPPAALPFDRIVYDINLDMLGSYAQAGAVYAMGTFPRLPATAIVKAVMRERASLHVGVGGRASRSDHTAFCRAGIPYVFFWTPDKRCYHTRCDTAGNLDAAHLGEIAAFAGELVERLSNSPADLAASRRRLGCSGR